MKRLGLTLVAALCLAATTFAAANIQRGERVSGYITCQNSGKYLNLSSVQAEEVANICNYFDEQMGRATTSKKNKDTLVRNAVYGNLKLMKKTLTDAQYTKYTTILNMTLKNKGIEVK